MVIMVMMMKMRGDATTMITSCGTAWAAPIPEPAFLRAKYGDGDDDSHDDDDDDSHWDV